MEQITAEAISGKNPVNVNIKKSTRLFGGVEPKKILEGEIGHRNVSLIEREFSEKYVTNWQMFRHVGLPVVPSLRKGSNGKLLVTNVKADGSEIYGKGLFVNLSTSGITRENPRLDIDKIFLQLTNPDAFSSVESKVNEYLKIAEQNRIILPTDDAFEMVVHPNGTWNLMILDLSSGGKVEGDINRFDINGISGVNQHAADTFLSHLKLIREVLKKVDRHTNLAFLDRLRQFLVK